MQNKSSIFSKKTKLLDPPEEGKPRGLPFCSCGYDTAGLNCESKEASSLRIQFTFQRGFYAFKTTLTDICTREGINVGI